MGGGFLVAVSTFLLWRPQQRVFFDRICIDSINQKVKTDTIYSLAGILKSSEEMLILWDSTWSKRLWCVFELAAFLKSKEGGEKALLIRPTFLGQSAVTTFLTVFISFLPVVVAPVDGKGLIPALGLIICGPIAAFFNILTFRRYFCSVEVLKTELQSMDFDKTRSACCDTNHGKERKQPTNTLALL
eukprot:s4644_g4.t1